MSCCRARRRPMPAACRTTAARTFRRSCWTSSRSPRRTSTCRSRMASGRRATSAPRSTPTPARRPASPRATVAGGGRLAASRWPPRRRQRMWSMSAPILSMRGISKRFGAVQALEDVNNLFLGREERLAGPGQPVGWMDEIDMERRGNELLQTLSVRIPSVRIQVASLSGGQRQSVAIARSLIGEPKVVLLDEPTAALGVAQTAQVLDLVHRLRERGLAVVVISHNLSNVFAVADRITVLRLGKNGGDFRVGTVSQEKIVAAITGATGEDDGGVGRRPGLPPTAEGAVQ